MDNLKIGQTFCMSIIFPDASVANTCVRSCQTNTTTETKTKTWATNTCEGGKQVLPGKVQAEEQAGRLQTKTMSCFESEHI